MIFLTTNDREFCDSVKRLMFSNPFSAERLQRERELLGDRFDEHDTAWQGRGDTSKPRANVLAIGQLICQHAQSLRAKLREHESGNICGEDRQRYQRLILSWLFLSFEERFFTPIVERPDEESAANQKRYAAIWVDFLREGSSWLPPQVIEKPVVDILSRWFALCFQVRRAFHHVFRRLTGYSKPMDELRQAIWESIFTHDMERYDQLFHDQMRVFSTLILGETGTGKELAAEAIARSAYIPFDPISMTFRADFYESFLPVNISAMPDSLVESELFGHAEGAFTDAKKKRTGIFGQCSEWGSVFLDEIGELNTDLQVKLLRVLQNREFRPVGDDRPQRFKGRLIAATNADIVRAVQEEKFREDLLYRLCSDTIRMPSFRDQIRDSPEELLRAVTWVLRDGLRWPEAELSESARKITSQLNETLGLQHEWRGNFRELEQHVRSAVLHEVVKPFIAPKRMSTRDWIDDLRDGSLSNAELLKHYHSLVLRKFEGNKTAAAKALGINKQTLKC